MLVIISDLHLCDGSAATNVPPEAFGLWLDEVLGLAQDNGENRDGQKQPVKELVLLYIGDVFDLLRTGHWFYPAPGEKLVPNPPLKENFALEDRPWGSAELNERNGKPSHACLVRAREIFARIAEECGDSLALLRGDLAGLSPGFRQRKGPLIERLKEGLKAVKVTRLYLPGNHDRLYLHDDELATAMRKALGATAIPPEKGGPHAYKDAEYGVIARHGHEWDVWNFEAHREKQDVQVIAPDKYKLVPIGDPITTELVARLPYEMYVRLSGDARTTTLAKGVYERLMQIEDVRPLHAAITWVIDEGRRIAGDYDGQGALVRDTLEQTIKQVMADFMQIPFVHHWLDQHDRFNLTMDEADMLQDLDRALRILDLEDVETALAIVDKVEQWGNGNDECSRGAGEERLLSDARSDHGIRYCVYGHTHTFRHEPLRCDADGNEIVYFNSGTWRPRVVRTRDKMSFVGYKDIAYLVFYSGSEDAVAGAPAKGTSYEAWHGVMLKRPR